MASSAKVHRLTDLHLIASEKTKPEAPREVVGPTEKFFDKLPELLRLEEVKTLFGISRATVYNWKYRQKKLGVPSGLFLKFNRKLFIRTEVLKRWIASQNPSVF